jgi:hypothetical protein
MRNKISASGAFTPVQRQPDIGSHPGRCDPRYRQLEQLRHHAGDDVSAAIQREWLSNDSRIGSQLPPQRIRNDDAIFIVEPLAENGINSQLMDERRRDCRALHVTWLAAEHEIFSGLAIPPERIKHSGACAYISASLDRRDP